MLPSNTQAPEFQLLDQFGASIRQSDIMGKRGLVLLFFASHWLSGDRQNLASYAKAYSRFQETGFEIAAISSTDWENLHTLSKELALPFPVLFDPCARISKRYGVMSIPRFVTGRAVYALDPAGHILLRQKAALPDELLLTLNADW